MFLFLLSTLVWHPQLTDGYFPSLQNNGASGKGDTSSLVSPVPGLQINRLALTEEDEAPDTPGDTLAGCQLPALLLTSPGEESHRETEKEQLDTQELWFPEAKAPAPCQAWLSTLTSLPTATKPSSRVPNSAQRQTTTQTPTCHPRLEPSPDMATPVLSWAPAGAMAPSVRELRNAALRRAWRKQGGVPPQSL